jgi:hypothetical protein
VALHINGAIAFENVKTQEIEFPSRALMARR